MHTNARYHHREFCASRSPHSVRSLEFHLNLHKKSMEVHVAGPALAALLESMTLTSDDDFDGLILGEMLSVLQ